MFRVTHPFHPRFGREFPLVFYRQYRSEGRVLSQDEQGREFRIPDHWTSLIPPDAFVVISDGRSFFRIRDLLKLTQLVKDLGGKKPRLARQGRQESV
jgi:hypothetical protein